MLGSPPAQCVPDLLEAQARRLPAPVNSLLSGVSSDNLDRALLVAPADER